MIIKYIAYVGEPFTLEENRVVLNNQRAAITAVEEGAVVAIVMLTHFDLS